jgi:hypothetical protein
VDNAENLDFIANDAVNDPVRDARNDELTR